MIIAAGRPRRSVLVRLGVVALAAGTAASVVATEPAQATAAAPAPISNLHATHVYDHTVVLAWDAASSVDDVHAKVIMRATIGRTPAATPSAGYPVSVDAPPRTATKRPLSANTYVTFAGWVEDTSGHLSAPRTLTVLTKKDVTPPKPEIIWHVFPRLSPTADPTAQSDLYWLGSGDVDYHGARILRTASDWAHAVVLQSDDTKLTLRDTAALKRDATYYYYVAARDTSGLLSPYTKIKVVMNVRRVSGTFYPYDDSQTGGGDHSFPSIDTDPPQNLLAENPGPAEIVSLPGDTGGSDQKSDFHVDLQPGHYSVCQTPDANPLGGSDSLGSCWNGHEAEPWGYDEPQPADTKGATAVTDHDLTGITLD